MCTAVCSECDSRLCTGCKKGAPCVVKADVFPPRQQLLNARGKPYFPDVYKQLEDYRTTWRAKNNMTAKSTRLVDAAAGGDGSDAEDQYDQYHLF